MVECLLIAAAIELAVLVLGGGLCLRRNRRGSILASDSKRPSASVIVPVAGAEPGLADQFESLANQDGADYEVIFVTGSSDDPANEVIREFLARLGDERKERFRHCVAGAAARCSQKNWNLLAGVAAARPMSEVLAFCDTCHKVPSDWLKTLLAPIAAGEAGVSSGYHFIVPCDGRVMTAARAVVVMGLHLVQSLPLSGQPWGGSMAIRRRLFEELEVPTLWSTNVVDDVSLAKRLRARGVPFRIVTSACFETPLGHERARDAWNWMSRQLLYPKFVSPEVWLGTGLALLVPSSALVAACAAPALGVPFLLYTAAFAVIVRRSHPRPGPWRSWILGAFVAILSSGACFIASWFESAVVWRGITYRVGRGGVVRAIERELERAVP